MPLQSQYKIIGSFILGIAILLVVWRFTPPSNFPTNSIVHIEEGTGLFQLSEKLEEGDIIRSPFWFRVLAIILRGERNMKAGEYYLDNPENTFRLAWRIFHGQHGFETVKITIPEGFTNEKISLLFDDRFPLFDNELFEKVAPQGYLFPDTYFIIVNSTATSTIKLLRDNFDKKVLPVLEDIEASGKMLDDVIKMASLIEAEANNQEDREIISGILWKRLKIGMALQVDVDLRTYEFPGLPDNPINNPGLDSIRATIHPKESPYLYYLTGRDGKMYYAKDFDGHKENIAKYLK